MSPQCQSASCVSRHKILICLASCLFAETAKTEKTNIKLTKNEFTSLHRKFLVYDQNFRGGRSGGWSGVLQLKILEMRRNSS